MNVHLTEQAPLDENNLADLIELSIGDDQITEFFTGNHPVGRLEESKETAAREQLGDRQYAVLGYIGEAIHRRASLYAERPLTYGRLDGLGKLVEGYSQRRDAASSAIDRRLTFKSLNNFIYHAKFDIKLAALAGDDQASLDRLLDRIDTQPPSFREYIYTRAYSIFGYKRKQQDDQSGRWADMQFHELGNLEPRQRLALALIKRESTPPEGIALALENRILEELAGATLHGVEKRFVDFKAVEKYLSGTQLPDTMLPSVELYQQAMIGITIAAIRSQANNDHNCRLMLDMITAAATKEMRYANDTVALANNIMPESLFGLAITLTKHLNDTRSAKKEKWLFTQPNIDPKYVISSACQRILQAVEATMPLGYPEEGSEQEAMFDVFTLLEQRYNLFLEQRLDK